MNKSFLQFETHVQSYADLASVSGRPGRSVLVKDTGVRHTWSAGGAWVATAAAEYLVYTCQIAQTGTNNPFDNVLGAQTLSADFITWERLGVGTYRGTLAGAFPDNRTQLRFNPVIVPLSGAMTSPPQGITVSYVAVERVDDDTIMISQVAQPAADAALELVDGLYDFNLEVRVYATNSIRD